MFPLKLVPDNTNIPFLKWRNIAMTMSILLIIGSIALCAVRGFNLGIDFVGGTQITVPATGDNGRITVEQAKDAYRDALGHGPEKVQVVGTGGNQSIEIESSSAPLPV